MWLIATLRLLTVQWCLVLDESYTARRLYSSSQSSFSNIAALP